MLIERRLDEDLASIQFLNWSPARKWELVFEIQLPLFRTRKVNLLKRFELIFFKDSLKLIFPSWLLLVSAGFASPDLYSPLENRACPTAGSWSCPARRKAEDMMKTGDAADVEEPKKRFELKVNKALKFPCNLNEFTSIESFVYPICTKCWHGAFSFTWTFFKLVVGTVLGSGKWIMIFMSGSQPKKLWCGFVVSWFVHNK